MSVIDEVLTQENLISLYPIFVDSEEEDPEDPRKGKTLEECINEGMAYCEVRFMDKVAKFKCLPTVNEWIQATKDWPKPTPQQQGHRLIWYLNLSKTGYNAYDFPLVLYFHDQVFLKMRKLDDQTINDFLKLIPNPLGVPIPNPKKESPKFFCYRCSHSWTSRKSNPRACPNCNSRVWNKPREDEYTEPSGDTDIPDEV